MEILGVQIASITFSVFMIYFSYLSYKKGYFEIYTLFIWLLIFISLILATLLPHFFTPFANILKFTRVFDLFTVIGIFFLIVITFINFISMQKIKMKMEKVVQNKALKESASKEELRK